MSSIGRMAATVTADVGGFTSGMSQVKGQIAGMTAGSGLAKFGAMIPGLAAVTSVAAIVAGVKSMADAMDDIIDKSELMGVTAERFQELAITAKFAGTDIDALANGMNKMNKFIFEAASGSREAEAALRIIGLSAKDLIAMTIDQRLKTIATALMGVENSAMRAALEMQILGKSGRSLELLLKEVDKGTDKVNKFWIVSSQSAEAWKEMRDAAVMLGSGVSSFIAEWSGALLALMVGLDDAGKSAAELAEENKKRADDEAKYAAEQLKQIERNKKLADGLKEIKDIHKDIAKAIAETQEATGDLANPRSGPQKQLDALIKRIEEMKKQGFGGAPVAAAEAMIPGLKAAVAAYDAEQKRIDKQKDSLKEIEESQRRINEILEDDRKFRDAGLEIAKQLRTEEEKIADAMKDVTLWVWMGALTADQAARFVAGQRTKTDMGESPLARKDSAEAYQQIVQAQAKFMQRDMELSELKQIKAAVERSAKALETKEPDQVATVGAGV